MAVVRSHGAVEAPKRLLVGGDIQTSFERSIQGGRPELTAEHAVPEPKWAPLLDEQHQAAARWRLRQAGLDVE